jgi:hypothetical protein
MTYKAINILPPSKMLVPKQSRIECLQTIKQIAEVKNNIIDIKINTIDKEITAIENYIVSNNEVINIYRELMQLNKEQIAIIQDTNKKLLALFDKKPNDSTKISRIKAREAVEQQKVTKELKLTDTEIKTLKAKASTLNKQIAVSTKERVALSNPVSNIRNTGTKSKTGKVFDYVPKAITYKPTPDQISVNIVSSNTQYSEIVKLPTISIHMRQMLHYSQKNLLESIMNRIVASKLV